MQDVFSLDETKMRGDEKRAEALISSFNFSVKMKLTSICIEKKIQIKPISDLSALFANILRNYF